MKRSATAIRSGEQCDLEAVAALEAATFDDNWSREAIERAVESPLVELLVAIHNRQFAGYLLYQSTGDELELWRVAVVPQLRRQGIARLLFGEMEQRFSRSLAAAKAVVGSGWIEVRDDNLSAAAFYRSIGFREEGRRKSYYHNGADALVMCCRFEPDGSQN